VTSLERPAEPEGAGRGGDDLADADEPEAGDHLEGAAELERADAADDADDVHGEPADTASSVKAASPPGSAEPASSPSPPQPAASKPRSPKPRSPKPATADPRSADDIKELTDPRELRALTHPVRLALLEALRIHKQLTATEAGDLIGESPTTCSFHLRQLSKYGFVKEADRGAGRRRPWVLAHQGMRFATSDNDDADLTVAATALENLLVRIWFDRFEAWERVRHTYSEDWRRASDVTEMLVYVTPDELIQLAEERNALFERYKDRSTDPAARPAGAEPVEVISFAFPLQSRAR
jgi:predicted transcriptional regulator